jgi:hypothetical protein
VKLDEPLPAERAAEMAEEDEKCRSRPDLVAQAALTEVPPLDGCVEEGRFKPDGCHG